MNSDREILQILEMVARDPEATIVFRHELRRAAPSLIRKIREVARYRTALEYIAAYGEDDCPLPESTRHLLDRLVRVAQKEL